MQLKIERRDYKTRRQMDIIARRLIMAGFSTAQEAIGAPLENLRVSFRPSQLEKVREVIMGKK